MSTSYQVFLSTCEGFPVLSNNCRGRQTHVSGNASRFYCNESRCYARYRFSLQGAKCCPSKYPKYDGDSVGHGSSEANLLCPSFRPSKLRPSMSSPSISGGPKANAKFPRVHGTSSQYIPILKDQVCFMFFFCKASKDEHNHYRFYNNNYP